MLVAAFGLILVVVLLGATTWFTAMGIAQVRRTRRMTRAAHQSGMLFFSKDPFDLPQRYGRFALMRSGHSPKANNVCHGRHAYGQLRSFDFRFELGHGTRRISRHYVVVTAEADTPVPEVLMWHEDDLEFAPLEIREGARGKGRWVCSGDDAMVETVSKVFGSDYPHELSLESHGQTLLACIPCPKGSGWNLQDLTRRICRVLGEATGQEQWGR
ncbi:MAG: hypothetical protein ACLFVU_01005 [Phycisphaerae bacterium]